MMDKNITKYINFQDSRYTWGMKADGTWLCKEFKSDTKEEGEKDMISINMILNKVNRAEKIDQEKIELKSKKEKK